MASVQHYVCDAAIFPFRVSRRRIALQDLEKKRHFAALKIQSLWRGYLVRKEIERWNCAAIVLQKYIRRWLVLWHLPDFYQEYEDWYYMQYYNKMATRLQAGWRGYLVRRDRMSIKDSLAMKRRIEEANTKMQIEMQQAFSDIERLKFEKMEIEAEKWVRYIIFKLHHHLRSKIREGIYSKHGTSSLSEVEKYFKQLPLESYMKELKQRYYEEISKEEKPPGYMFESKLLQRLEDIYRNKDAKDEVIKLDFDSYFNDKAFILTPKLDKKMYARMLLTTENYSPIKYDICRDVEKSKFISDKDFDLHVHKKVKFMPKIPPYHPEVWSKPCSIHKCVLHR